MAYLLYILYRMNLDKLKKGNPDSIFYKAKITSNKISLFGILLVLAFLIIGTLQEAIELMMK